MLHLLIAVLLLAGTAFAQEDKLIAVLKSDVPLNEKADACQELSHVGTRQAVPALTSLLADEKLSLWARYALEPISDSTIDVAFRDALGKLKGQLLVGVIGSIGVRKDTEAVEPLAKLLTDADPAVAQAAAKALGRIGSAAVPALERALTSGSQTNRFAICEGLFRCAESMKGAAAAAIYDKVQALPNLPYHVRVAALRGAILSRGAEGVSLLALAIRNEKPVSAGDAIRISMDIPGGQMTTALVGEIPEANEEKQFLLLQTLGNRGDATASPALEMMAQSGAANRRIAAIRSLVQLGNQSSLPVLTALVKDPEVNVAGAAQTGLSGFSGKEADAAVLALLNEPDAKIRVAIIKVAAQRRIIPALPALLKAAGDADAGVASAGFRALGELAGVAEIPGMVDAMLKTKAVPAAESGLSAICARQPDETICTDKLLPGLAKAQGEPKLALLRVLGTIGGPQALGAVRVAASESDATVKETALLALCDWPTVDALPELAHIARSNADAKFKILALRGQLRLIPMQTVVDAQKFSQLKEILPLIQRKEEKILAVGILGNIPSAESLALVMPYLAGEGLKEEASVAAVAIGEKIVASHPAEVAEAMKQVQTGNNELAARARKLSAH